MPHDRVRIADARGWLEKAALDLGAGDADLAHDPPICGDAMFHAQQAVEKSLKGFLAWHEIPFRKTHDLRELFAGCGTIESSVGILAARVEGLTPYAWIFRYPGESEEPQPQEARAALALAQEAYEAVLSGLPSEVRP